MEGYRDIQILFAKKAGIGKVHFILDAGTGLAALLAIHLARLVGNPMNIAIWKERNDEIYAEFMIEYLRLS